MRKTLYFLSAIIISLANFITIMPASAKSCPDLQFIFARGSGESLNGPSMQAWQGAIEAQIKDSSLTYEFYELGSKKYDGFQYSAVAVAGSMDGYMNLLGAVISGGESLEFGSSVIAGSKELRGFMQTTSKVCPQTRYVLGGYSQGAMVLSRSLNQIDANKIVFVSTYGDPKLYLPEGKGIVPAACLGHNYSNYRIYVPDCHAYEGVLGSYRPYQPEAFIDKLGAWCNTKDIMCSSGMSLQDHTSYVEDNIYTYSANKITQKIKESFPQNNLAHDTSGISGEHDLAIIIDSTGSMSSMIGAYKAEARRAATKVFASGGRVALYEYRDLADPFETVQHCDYSCTLDDFVAKLDNIKVDGGGDNDESALSAILYTMNSLKWKIGATKSIILLTDAKYLAPDRDGVTLAEVTKRSLEIDPVNIYVMTNSDQQEFYQELAQATNGKVFDIDRDLDASTEIILGRPVAMLSGLEYIGDIGDTLRFDASLSYSELGEDLRFDWDLDGDGEFELLDKTSIIERSYTDAFTGFVQVRVSDVRGASSTMSAKVEISPTTNPASIRNLSSTPLTDRSARISFETDAEKVLVAVNDNILGYLDPKLQSSFVLENIQPSREVRLIPYSNNRRGVAATVIATPITPTAPNTGFKGLESGIWRSYAEFY